MMLNLVCALAVGIFARRAIKQFPEFEVVVWVVLILGVIVLGAMHGRLTVLEVP